MGGGWLESDNRHGVKYSGSRNQCFICYFSVTSETKRQQIRYSLMNYNRNGTGHGHRKQDDSY